MALSKRQDVLAQAIPKHLQTVANLSSSSAFNASYQHCDLHGSYQANHLDDEGLERWLPRCPRCAAQAKTNGLVARAAIPLRFQNRRFENFDARSPGHRRALTVSTSFADNFADAKKRGAMLTFAGKPGTGKTHLACAIAHQVMSNGYSALFATVSEVIRKIRETWQRGSEQSEAQIIQQFARVDLLIIDEVGVQYGTEAEQNTLFQVIDRRYANLQPMILLTNLSLYSNDQNTRTLLNFLGERSYDRLREDGQMVIFDWESHRGQKDKN